MSLKHLESYIIVVNGDRASEYYYNLVLPKWHQLGIQPKKFNACTPTTISPDLTFDYCNFYGFDGKGYRKQYTPTEKACFSSHYMLWNMCWELGSRMLILEHDAYPLNLQKICDDEQYDFYGLARGMGAYVISPSLAGILVDRIQTHKDVIDTGPLGFIDYVCEYRSELGIRKELRMRAGEASNLNMPVRHVFNPEYGLTIDHYTGTDLEQTAHLHSGEHDLIIATR